MPDNKPITFARFEAVLAELGFRKNVVPGECVTYEHVDSGVVLYVRLHKLDEVVPWDVMASARHHLEWRGVIKPKDFEEMLHGAAA